MSDFRLNVSYMVLKNSNVKAFYAAWTISALLLLTIVFKAISLVLAPLSILVLLFLGGTPFVFVPYQVFVMSKEGNRIYADKERLYFSPLTCPGLGFRLTRRWSDLSYATINCQNPARLSKHDHLLLRFRSGGFARLFLDRMSGDNREQLLLAIDLLAGNCEKTAELVAYQEFQQNENKGREGFSYTKLWEDELARRFQSTSFVPLAPGDRLENMGLKIIQQLAFGGFSAVYIAEQPDGEKVVLKESVPCRSASQAARAKAEALFDREAEILTRLQHKAIAKVLGSFSERNNKYLVLQYVQGPNLRQLVRSKGKQSVETVLNWAIEMCDILDYLHRQAPPVMHRDFTPDNLVVGKDGSLTLVDFGAANEYIGTVTGTLIGKQCYMPPEQVRGKPQPASDLFALGGTLHFLLTGIDPIPLVPCRPREIEPEIPLDVSDLIAALTDLEISGRPRSADDVKAAVMRISEAFKRQRAATASSAQGSGSFLKLPGAEVDEKQGVPASEKRSGS